jgi:hypothetical protein
MPSKPIPVPARLSHPHSVIRAARDALATAQPSDDGRISVAPRPGMPRILTSRAQQNRALRIAQAVIVEAERRGYEVVDVEKSYNHKAGIGIAINGHDYPIEITEQTDRVPLTPDEVRRWNRLHPYWEAPSHRQVPNGKLRISTAGLYSSGRRSNFTEGVRGPLEPKLNALLTELEQRAVIDEKRKREWQRREAARQRQLEEERARARRQELERQRVARLREEIEAWQLAQQVDAYVAALRTTIDEVPTERRNVIQEWCDWAEGWASKTNPARCSELVRGLERPDGQTN